MNKLKTLEELSSSHSDNGSKLDVLLLANGDYSAGCCLDYINAIKNNSNHRVTVRNPMAKSRSDKLFLRPYTSLKNDDGKSFDVIIIHYSICIIFRSHISFLLRKKIRNFKGLKIVIIQDEYRWINRILKEMIYLNVDCIVSLLDKENINKVYDHPQLKNKLKVSALAGYVSNNWIDRDVPGIAERKKHIIYRGNNLPFWLGNGAHEKSVLSEKICKNFQDKDLNLDVSSNPRDRIYGENWLDFMKSGKCVFGLEGGASIFDFDGSIEKKVRKFQSENPRASYEKIHREFLSSFEDKVYYRMITPRSFEAIATKTVQVMYPGEYSGILEPWRHYIPINRDFSNLTEVIEALKNDEFLQEMANQAYSEIIKSQNYSEEKLGRGIDSIISNLLRKESYPMIDE
jgi:hypothetical protein